MARIFITGSADGLGQLAAKRLADQGHQVVLHARNAERARTAKQKVPGAEHVIVTQTWLAVSNDSSAKVSGRYFYHRTEKRYNPQASDVKLQERFLGFCRESTAIPFPE